MWAWRFSLDRDSSGDYAAAYADVKTIREYALGKFTLRAAHRSERIVDALQNVQ